jgi:hypothetical protein
MGLCHCKVVNRYAIIIINNIIGVKFDGMKFLFCLAS